MEETLVLQLPASRGDASRVILATRNSIYATVLEMFADPRCGEETKELVREFITGKKHTPQPV